VDAYRLEIGLVADQDVKINFVNKVLNSIDNCLARRVAYGLGILLPAVQGTPNVSGITYPSKYPLRYKTPQPVLGLNVVIITDNAGPSAADLAALQQVFDAQQLLFDVIAPHQGPLSRGASATQSYITKSSVFYDAVIVAGNNTQSPDLQAFVQEAYTHGKPIGALGGSSSLFRTLEPQTNIGLFSETSTTRLAQDIAGAIALPGRYPQRLPIDDVQAICG
jgi:catalase